MVTMKVCARPVCYAINCPFSDLSMSDFLKFVNWFITVQSKSWLIGESIYFPAPLVLYGGHRILQCNSVWPPHAWQEMDPLLYGAVTLGAPSFLTWVKRWWFAVHPFDDLEAILGGNNCDAGDAGDEVLQGNTTLHRLITQLEWAELWCIALRKAKGDATHS